MSIPAQVIDRRARQDRRQTEPHPVTEDLADALTSDSIQLLFQPQFRSADGAYSGCRGAGAVGACGPRCAGW